MALEPLPERLLNQSTAGDPSSVLAETNFGPKRATGDTKPGINLQVHMEFHRHYLRPKWNQLVPIGVQTQLRKFLGA